MNTSLRLRFLLSAVLGVAACAQLAMAADLGGAPPRRVIHEGPSPYDRAFSWSGLYIGAHIGYGWSEADWQFSTTPGVSTSHGGNGGLLGGQIGYNIQSGHFVWGIEGDLSAAWLDGGTSCPNPGFNCQHSYNWLASVRGRAGTLINGNRTLLYVTGGAAWADVDYAAKDAATGALFGTGFSNTHFGWVAGAGIEHRLTHNLSAKLEYLYYGFDSVTAPAGTLGAGPASLDLTSQTLRFGLNFKF